MNIGFSFAQVPRAETPPVNEGRSRRMKTGLALAAAALMAFGASAPALADDDWKRDNRRWSQDRDDRRWDDRRDRRDEARAYRNGYRDGWRAENRRDGWRGQTWRGSNNGYRYDDRGNWNGNWNGNSNYRYPTWRGASVNGSAPYWWGNNGQVYCRRQDGTAGLIVGALAGGTLGNVIAREGDKRLGSVIGGTLGAVLGNELAKGNVRCR
jgi:hypothetical protein